MSFGMANGRSKGLQADYLLDLANFLMNRSRCLLVLAFQLEIGIVHRLADFPFTAPLTS
jgi:hypothetical protein